MDFNELYESYFEDVYRFALWLSGKKTEAEDITSETFVRAWTRRDSIRTQTLKAYLLKIARNVHLGQIRAGRRVDPLEDVHSDPSPGPDRHTESRIELGWVWDMLSVVDETDRSAFILRALQEMPYTEIARILGISVSAAKVKVHRVRKRLLMSRLEREEQRDESDA